MASKRPGTRPKSSSGAVRRGLFGTPSRRWRAHGDLAEAKIDEASANVECLVARPSCFRLLV